MRQIREVSRARAGARGGVEPGEGSPRALWARAPTLAAPAEKGGRVRQARTACKELQAAFVAERPWERAGGSAVAAAWPRRHHRNNKLLALGWMEQGAHPIVRVKGFCVRATWHVIMLLVAGALDDVVSAAS